MLVRLQLPFADVRASDLSLTLGALPEPALEVLHLDLDGVPLELRLLGCSHQAIAPGLSETVACRPGAPGHLPPVSEQDGYRFEARVERMHAGRVRALLAEAQADPAALAAVFPGPQDAFTALRARAVPGGVSWETWHGYPQTGELVHTWSVLRP